MPKGTPTSEQLLAGKVAFFSIDTDLIQAAGYNFDAGALNQLPKQLPKTMKLLLSGVVAEEIVRHRMKPVQECLQSLQSAAAASERLTGIVVKSVTTEIEKLDILGNAAAKFRGEVESYAKRCRGGVLGIGGVNLAEDAFSLYFSESPPFGKRKDKKSEFPDAVSLLLLERHAKANQCMGIVASGDDGWRQFAESSDWLYCVKSIDELAELFAATDAHSKSIRQGILAAIGNNASALMQQLAEALRKHVAESTWDVSELYNSGRRVEAEHYNSELESYSVDVDDVSVWFVDGDPSTWVIELVAEVVINVDVGVQFYIWDSVDREELPFGHRDFTFDIEETVEAFVTCSGVKAGTTVKDWELDVDIAPGTYSMEACEVEQDFADGE